MGGEAPELLRASWRSPTEEKKRGWGQGRERKEGEDKRGMRGMIEKKHVARY
jgi:hypothetical protein